MCTAVPQSEIDKLRGTRDHQAAGSITWQDVQAQYAKVGIPVTEQYAKEVHGAIQAYSGNGAPVFSSSKYSVIYRGISSGYTPEGVAYAQKLMALKVGETLDLDHMPSSFSSKYITAQAFASGKGGIIIHAPVSSLKNSTSIKGISVNSGEDEILVANYDAKISKIDNQLVNGDGYYHIHVQ